MEKELNEYLREGERVQWQGKPEAFPLMENGSRTQILRKWILTVLIAGGLLACYLNYNQHPSKNFVGMVLVVAAVVMVSPFTEKSGLMKNRYWITNQRLIQLTKDGNFYYMELGSIDEFRIVEGAAEKKCLAVGSAVFGDVKKQLRWRASHPMTDAENQGSQAVGMILYGLGNAEAAAALLRDAGCTKAA